MPNLDTVTALFYRGRDEQVILPINRQIDSILYQLKYLELGYTKYNSRHKIRIGLVPKILCYCIPIANGYITVYVKFNVIAIRSDNVTYNEFIYHISNLHPEPTKSAKKL